MQPHIFWNYLFCWRSVCQLGKGKSQLDFDSDSGDELISWTLNQDPGSTAFMAAVLTALNTTQLLDESFTTTEPISEGSRATGKWIPTHRDSLAPTNERLRISWHVC